MAQGGAKRRWNSEPWVDRLALQGQHTKDALMNSPERFSAYEAFQGFKTKA